MDRRDFDRICETIIRKLGDDLAARTFLKDKEGKHVLTFSGEWDSALYDRYQGWREHAHSLMRKPDMLIDRHKIVACFMLAILENSPLQAMEINPGGLFQPIVRICNEVLAFQVGMKVLTRFNLEDAMESGQRELCKRLLEPMCYPQSTAKGEAEKSESYLSQMYRALYHLRLQLHRERLVSEPGRPDSPQRKQRFRGDQFLLLANLVFMLEQYNLYVKNHYHV